MSPPSAALLTKVPRSPSLASQKETGIPPVLLESIPRRLVAIATVVLIVHAVAWLGVNLLQGQLGGELTDPGQWLGPVIAMLASVALLALVRARRVTLKALSTIGLTYQVVVSYAIVLGSYWGAFQAVAAETITADRVGLSFVGVWMLGYTALVPARPGRALVALLGSSSAAPVVFALNTQLGLAPALDLERFVIVLILPYLICTYIALVIAGILFDLGTEVRRARALGSYKLRERIGSGGMGEVWRADHALLARPAAVKLIQPSALASSAEGANQAVARFEREAQVTAALESPHSVKLYDFGVSTDGTLYYVMELLDGMDLQSLVNDHGPMPPERVIRVLGQVCQSLAEAHHRGLVHRDIKPANIVLARYAGIYDFAKVLDFGLAKVRDSSEVKDASPVGPDTHANTVIGTPAYLAPEVALASREADGRADIYALGCVAFWLLCGETVFSGATAMATVVAHATEQPPSVAERCNVALPAGLEEIIQACLAKDPTDRPPSAEELSRRLQAVPLAQAWSQDRAAAWWQTRAAPGDLDEQVLSSTTS